MISCRLLYFDIGVCHMMIVMIDSNKEKDYDFATSLGISFYTWLIMSFYTWILTGECLIGQTKCKLRCMKCVKCFCCGWNKFSKAFVIFLLVGSWLAAIIGRSSGSGSGNFLGNYFTSLFLEFCVTGPVLDTMIFAFWYYTGEMGDFRKKEKRAEQFTTKVNAKKAHKNFIVTAPDIMIWQGYRNDEPIELIAEDNEKSKSKSKSGDDDDDENGPDIGRVSSTTPTARTLHGTFLPMPLPSQAFLKFTKKYAKSSHSFYSQQKDFIEAEEKSKSKK